MILQLWQQTLNSISKSLNTSPRNVGIAIGLAVSTVSVLMITSQSKQARGKKLPIYGLFSALNDMIRYAGKGKQHLLLASIQERQGPYVGIMSPADGLLVLTSDHGLIHKAYTSPDFRRDEFFVPKSKGLLDYALFVLPTSETWKIHRKWIQPAFGPKQLKWAAQVSQREAAAWLNDFQGGEEVDILNEFTCLTLDIMQSFDAVKSLHSNSSESHETDLHKAMQTIMNTYQERLATPQILWPIYGISNSSRQVKNAREYIDNLMTNILATKRASSPSPSHQAHEDLLDRLLAPSTDATTPKFTDAEILGETFGFFLAGHETTANTLTFVALELSRNPSIQESLKKEIKHLLRVYPTLTQETLHHFTYLDQVLRETQRLHPIVGIALRTSTAEVEHDGYIFPAGTKVGLHLMAMHRDSRVFGKDATTWNPDRWSSTDAPHVSSVIAFGEGIHNCIGQKVALIEVKIILIELLRRFTIHLVEDQKIEFVTSTTYGLKKGLKVRLVEDA
ncbi:hypothetical protein HDU79_000859 [Rhizoclosmatium sp. JEL0117]|nr:hypothetical protein HDU79_000859 [Rhizoclosmatium sp. JEL0117]